VVSVGFDIYGTLIDTNGVTDGLRRLIGARAAGFAQLWREKQLEYSFRSGLMQNYRDFAACTSAALDYCCLALDAGISAEQKQHLLAVYRELPAFPDAREGLDRVASAGFRMYAFSNGRRDSVQHLLASAGIDHYFLDVISVDEIKSFKPNPAVYCHFLRRAKSTGAEAWLVSSNPFDVIGAISAGMRAAWVRRSSSAVFDPWEIQPTVTVDGLWELADALRPASDQLSSSG